jgi:hypothetical protein
MRDGAAWGSVCVRFVEGQRLLCTVAMYCSRRDGVPASSKLDEHVKPQFATLFSGLGVTKASPGLDGMHSILVEAALRPEGALLLG